MFEFNLGQIHRGLGHWGLALQHYRSFLASSPALSASTKATVQSLIAQVEAKQKETAPAPPAPTAPAVQPEPDAGEAPSRHALLSPLRSSRRPTPAHRFLPRQPPMLASQLPRSRSPRPLPPRRPRSLPPQQRPHRRPRPAGQAHLASSRVPATSGPPPARPARRSASTRVRSPTEPVVAAIGFAMREAAALAPPANAATRRTPATPGSPPAPPEFEACEDRGDSPGRRRGLRSWPAVPRGHLRCLRGGQALPTGEPLPRRNHLLRNRGRGLQGPRHARRERHVLWPRSGLPRRTLRGLQRGQELPTGRPLPPGRHLLHDRGRGLRGSRHARGGRHDLRRRRSVPRGSLRGLHRRPALPA